MSGSTSAVTDRPEIADKPSPRTMSGNAIVIAGNDLRRRIRDKSILIQAILAPLLLSVVVGVAFSGVSSLSLTVAVVDADGTPLSRDIAERLLAASDADRGVEFVTAEPDAVEQAIADGDIDSAVVLPAGLTEDLQAGRVVSLQALGKAGSQVSTGVAAAIADGIAAQLQTVRVAQATAAEVADQAGVTLDPDRVAELVAASAPPFAVAEFSLEGEYSLTTYFAPGMAMLFLFFIIGDAARGIVGERQEGTLDRVLAAPVSARSVLLGKTGSVLVLGWTSLIAVWLLTSVLFQAEWGDPAGVLLVIFSVVFAIAGIALFIAGLARSRQQAEAATIIAALAFAVLGGTFFVANGGFLEVARQFTPNGQALIAFTDLGAGGAGVVDVLGNVVILLTMGVVLMAVGLAALARKVAR